MRDLSERLTVLVDGHDVEPLGCVRGLGDGHLWGGEGEGGSLCEWGGGGGAGVGEGG